MTSVTTDQNVVIWERFSKIITKITRKLLVLKVTSSFDEIFGIAFHAIIIVYKYVMTKSQLIVKNVFTKNHR